MEELCTKFQEDKLQASRVLLHIVQSKVGPLYLLMDASRATLANLIQQTTIFTKRCIRLEEVGRIHGDYTKALEEVCY